MEGNKSVGDLAEEQAAEFLSQQGYHILERNYRVARMEVDIICSVDDLLVFVEVKYRGIREHPSDAVPVHKQRLLLEAASLYVESKEDDREVRMDVIMMHGPRHHMTLEHFEDAFDGGPN